jgi:hypothetical protein
MTTNDMQSALDEADQNYLQQVIDGMPAGLLVVDARAGSAPSTAP